MKNIRLFENNDKLKYILAEQPVSCESKWLEYRFHKSLGRWQKINNRYSVYGFITAEEEISFFKYIKPRFIGVLNYYSKRYKNLLFRSACVKEQLRFLQEEFVKSEKFRCDHAEFYNYYTAGRSDRDNDYFKKILIDRSCAFDKLYDGNDGLSSPKDPLVADIITDYLYRNYLLRLLSSFNIAQTGAVIRINMYPFINFRNVAGF